MSQHEERSSSVHVGLPEDAAPKLDKTIEDELEAEEDAHLGVKAVEAAEKVYSRYSKWFLFVGIGLASYIYSLDGQTTFNYLAFATSAYDRHSLISTIQTAQSVIVAVGKPVIAKFADVQSRAQAYLLVLSFYVLGYIVIASSHSVGALAAGIIIYAVGYTGLQLLTSVIVADITTLKWRGLVSGLTSSPFIINAFVGSKVTTSALETIGWRWGYGMFAILVPASLSPLIATLTWAERKARKLGLITAPRSKPDIKLQRVRFPVAQRAWTFSQQLDLFGLILVGSSVALILLPLTLATSAKGGWNNPSIIAMLVIGCLLLPVVVFWEFKFAKRPILARRLLTNRTVIFAAWIGFFDFFSFYLTVTYLYSFILITKDWSLLNATYFNQAQSVALTVFGILAGVVMRFVHRYKWVLVAGLAIRLLGVGLMIHSRGVHGSDAEIVWTQILQGMGGGFAAVSSSVAAQAAVPHVDMAITTAMVLLWTEIGGAVGSAVAGAIWTNTMPDRIAAHLPTVDQATRDQLFGSITDIMTLPFDDPVRQGVIAAYGDVMKILLIAGTVLSVFPLLLSLLMPNWYLGNTQNAVDASNLKGERVVPASATLASAPQNETQEHDEKSTSV